MYQLTTFPNKLRLLTVPMNHVKSVTVLVMVAAGSRYESAKKAGLSHFLEHMFFKGTKNRPKPEDVTGAIDAVGGEFNAFTSKEHSGYYIKVSSKYLALAVEVLADILLNSTFAQREIQKEKATIIEEINYRADQPTIKVAEEFEALLYGQSNLGRKVIGEKSTLFSLKRGDLVHYLKNRYRSNNLVIGVAGAFYEETLKKLIEEKFSFLKEAKVKSFKKIKSQHKKPGLRLVQRPTEQAHLVLGVPALKREDRDRYKLAVLNAILGGNTSSRLFVELRERRGLAYYIKTETQAYQETGYLAVSAGVDVKRTEEAIKLILSQMAKLKDRAVQEKELKKGQEFLKGGLALDLEDSEAVAGLYTSQALLEKTIKTPEKIFQAIDNVSLEQVKKLAEKLFVPEHLNLALIGPFRREEKFAKLWETAFS